MGKFSLTVSKRHFLTEEKAKKNTKDFLDNIKPKIKENLKKSKLAKFFLYKDGELDINDTNINIIHTIKTVSWFGTINFHIFKKGEIKRLIENEFKKNVSVNI